MSTLTLTISRDGADLVLSARIDANNIGIVNFQEPGRMTRHLWAPDSAHMHGSISQGSSFQQALMSFDVVTHKATTEATSRTQLAELRTALAQFSYTVTVVIDGAPAEVWTCNTADIVPTGSRTRTSIEHHCPVWSVSIPCYPIPTVGA